MIPIDGQPILTAAQMRAAEERAAPTPDSMYALMERAGAAVADAARRMASGAEVLVLCGPGNNGGDGYVAARTLRDGGVPVRVASLTPPRTALARRAEAAWGGPTACYTTGDQTQKAYNPWRGDPPAAAPILVDALFGTGGREAYAHELWVAALRPFFEQARCRIAVDLPFGLSAAGEHRPPCNFTHADMTLALGALKPVHVDPTAGRYCGAIRVIDLGLDLSGAAVRVVERPALPVPGIWTHKYSRGMVGVIAGAMPGAARLAAMAAARAGAGYVTLFGDDGHGGPDALVRRPLTEEALGDDRLAVVVIGPGIGRDDKARHWVEWLVRKTPHTLVIDGDALHLIDPAWLYGRHPGVVLTPHGGEHRALMARLGDQPDAQGDPFGSSMAEVAALTQGPHVMVAKGATTVIADSDNVRVAPNGSPWLSTAGTGDVLAGAIGAMVANTRMKSWSLLDAATAGVWLHAEAARLCGASFIADDLAHALSAVRASL